MATENLSAPPVTRSRRPGRWLFRLGWLFCLLGLGIYAVQFFALHQLVVPWYAPILGSAGVVAILVATVRQWTVLRIIVLLVCGLLTSIEWHFLLVESRTPAYTGLAAGQRVPAFTAIRSDGSPFTDQQLVGQPTILLFFRGHW